MPWMISASEPALAVATARATPVSRTLQEWLAYAETVHAVGIDLGLDRVGRVAERLGFAGPERRPAPRTVIVAGTNGKGSTCIALEALFLSAGMHVGTTLSPHVHAFNERIRIDGREVDDATLCAAFAEIDRARGDIPLTYFEFSALAALLCFRRAGVDVAVLEVGLGGRLDAFNLVAADVAVVTSIGLDHQAFLGDDVETIGREKAGVFRTGQRVVVGSDVSKSVLDAAADLSCTLTRCTADFRLQVRPDSWDYAGAAGTLTRLPWVSLAPHNCALAIEAAAHFTALTGEQVSRALQGLSLPGRFECHWLDGPQGRTARDESGRLLLVDVAHNPAGARFLRDLIEIRYPGRRFTALVGMLADKDAAGLATAMEGLIGSWICAPTEGARALSGAELATRLRPAVAASCSVVAVTGAAEGLDRAMTVAADGILAFGSFSMVAQIRDLLAAGSAAGATAMDAGG
jgi:dihydrofolate synthase / folylpolyglutamate synthase